MTIGVTVAPNGVISVAEAGAFLMRTNRVIRIDPATGTQTVLVNSGLIGAPPNFTGAVSRKVHGGAGPFNLPLAP